MALGKFTAALASVTNELNVAAASFSFDFSLMKVEAPREFHPLGQGLSDQRRAEAESGLPHITARKLGALFKDVSPKISQLVKAYGKRVSEISEVPSVNPRGEGHRTVFESHVGADGTSIWAAATSGIDALHIQLLACMLARLWSGPEATSVWVELVKERKREIGERCENGETIDFGTIMATQQNIPRAQLAEWDASARSWLRSADEAKIREQKQLMLVIDNLDIPVSNDMRVYSSVIRAWKTALDSVEKLVTGMPLSLRQEGSILLGLSAWHLYPDLLILQEKVVSVTFNDSLIAPGGVLTVGLSSEDAENRKGVYWSLSLAHLRYYGDPILRERSYARDSSRVSMEQLGAVAIGSLSKIWEKQSKNLRIQSQDAISIATWFSALGGLFENHHMTETPNWISWLASVSQKLLRTTDLDHEIIMRLINVGKRHGEEFLVGREHRDDDPPFFGLSSFSNLLSVMEGDEERIKYLRKLASSYSFSATEAIIRYRNHDFAVTEVTKNPPNSEILAKARFGNAFQKTGVELAQMMRYWDDYPDFEYATAIPTTRSSTKRTASGSNRSNLTHKRWIKKELSWVFDTFPGKGLRCGGAAANIPPCDCVGKCYDDICSCIRHGIHCRRGCQIVTSGACREDCENTEASKLFQSRLHRLQENGEECFIQEQQMFEFAENTGKRSFITRVSPYTNDDAAWATFDLLLGDPDIAAIYVARESFQNPKNCQYAPANHTDVRDLIQLTESKLLSADLLELYLGVIAHPCTVPSESFVASFTPNTSIPAARYTTIYHSLRALAAAADIYKHIPTASIAIKVIQSPLCERHWARDIVENRTIEEIRDTLGGLKPLELDLASTFSCVALFESGHCDIRASLLDQVMALSSGDSLYVAAPMTCDPLQEILPYELRRIVGNVGRPGITMLVPTSNPLIRKIGPEQWNVITHADFDGMNQDSFPATTLHLSFTEYNLPVDLGIHGVQDNEVFILESIVSVHDAGKWVADLDIMKAMQSPRLLKFGKTPECKHKSMLLPRSKLTSLDSWDEVLDGTAQDWSIARACNNWVARLALATVAVNQMNETVVCDTDICWECFEESFRDVQGSMVLIH